MKKGGGEAYDSKQSRMSLILRPMSSSGREDDANQVGSNNHKRIGSDHGFASP